jgi:L-ribulose-5-phosphate 4-epimerase
MNFRQACLEANISLAAKNLAPNTWGNVSVIDRENGIVYIKPSGVPYERLRADDIVPVGLGSGRKIFPTDLNPSSDTPTHLVLYRHWPLIGSVVHTHSEYATSYAQTSRDLMAEGTTHADYFCGDIPCIPILSEVEVNGNYEHLTGLAIIRTFESRRADPMKIQACLISQHGPFAWGRSAEIAVSHATVIEQLARMAIHSRAISKEIKRIPDYLLERHFLRKNGETAYYGQSENPIV